MLMRKRFTRTVQSTPIGGSRLGLRTLLGGCILAWSSLAGALGLGEISLHSSLNQPLNADITLTDAAGLDEGDISVSLGTPEEFARAGLDRSFFLTDLRFTPLLRNGRQVIHVSSSKAVIEPSLSFIVQVTQPSGQLLRAYTLLIDPPGTVSLAPPLIATNARPEPVSSVAPMSTQAAPATPPPAAPRQKTKESTPRESASGEQLTATVAQNRQLQQTVDDLQARLASLEEERASRDQQLADLQARLTEAQALAAARAAAVPAPSAAQAPVAAQAGGAPATTTDAPTQKAGTSPAGAASTAAAPNVTPAPAPASAPAPTSAQAPGSTPPAPAPAPLVVAPDADDLTWLLQLGALLALLLLIAAWWLQRRRQRTPAPAEPELPRTHAQAETTAPEPLAPTLTDASPTAAASRREQGAATDALDAASIYIAYGRFNEALAVLREGLQRQPERRDLRLRILEVLGLQGNAHAYAEEEAALRANGEDDAVLQQTRSRFPKLAPAAVALVAGAGAAAGASLASAHAAAVSTTEPGRVEDEVSTAEPVLPAATPEPVHSDLDIDFDALGDLGAPDDFSSLAAEPAEPSPGEFQLNLDDLSLDADWSSVDPFDQPPAPVPRLDPTPSPPAPSADEALFFSNLRELPEVMELQEDEFLSGFADDPLEPLKPQGDDLDAAFLDAFADEPTLLPALEPVAAPGDDEVLELGESELPDLGELSIDFDDIEHQAQAAERLDEARALLDRGEPQQASWLLHELLQDGDEATREAARKLLAGL
jgi:pilus assembly protein FimV